MAGDGKFELAQSFGIDDGSLHGLEPEYVFAMGAEWEMFRRQLSRGIPFKTLCLPENRVRFVRMAEEHGRFVEDRQTGHQGWFEVWVGDYLD